MSTYISLPKGLLLQLNGYGLPVMSIPYSLFTFTCAAVGSVLVGEGWRNLSRLLPGLSETSDWHFIVQLRPSPGTRRQIRWGGN